MRWLGLVLVASMLPVTAAAHSRLIEPPSRSEIDFLMEGPCGGEPRGEATRYEAGEVVEMRWAATQSHSNTYRVAFSPAGDEGFEQNVLGSRPDDPEVFDYVQPVPMPMCTCDDCTLQLEQLTETGLLAYYSCADIELVAPEGVEVPECVVMGAGSGTGSGTGTGTGSGSGSGMGTGSGSGSGMGTGMGTGTGSGAGAGAGAGESGGAGCGVGGIGMGSGWGLVLLVAGGRRRRDTLGACTGHSKSAS
jgi:hypothetical protein